jgi:APA family basic amino acid/polyamine antiporter
MAKSGKMIGVAAATAVGLGAIIGAGIFVLSGSAIAMAGADSLIAFVLVGIVAFIIALQLGELGSMMPKEEGASYSYTYKAMGSEMGFISGIMRSVSLSTSISAIALGFGSYLASMMGFSIGVYAIPFAILLILVLSLVNIFGVKKAAEADLGLVAIKILILLIFVAFAMYFAISHMYIPSSSFALDFSGKGLSGIFAASVAIIFAYSGFQSISTLTDRIKGGTKGYIKALMGAVAISIIIYLLVVVALLLLNPPSAYTINADPLAFALKHSGAPQYLLLIIDIGALIATVSATIAMILTASRSFYQMGVDGLLPASLKKYDKKRDSAINGIIISAVIGIAMLFAGNVYVIAAISNFGLLFNYLVVGFDVIHFRRAGKKAPFQTPLYPYVTIIGIIAILLLFVGMPKEALIFGSVLIMLLIVLYYSLREIKMKKPVYIRLFDG